MIKKDKMQHVLSSFSSFEKTLTFTIDTFDKGNNHFLDIKVLNNGENDIYIKDTNAGIYVPGTHLGRPLYHSAKKICSSQQLFLTQINYMKTVMSWNGYPYYISTKIIRQIGSKHKGQRNNHDQDKENLTAILCKIPYASVQCDTLHKNLTKKNRPSLSLLS